MGDDLGRRDAGGEDRERFSRGPSSFTNEGSIALFQALGLDPGGSFLDLGCGPGDYSLAAAEIVGRGGFVYALDKWPRMIEALQAVVKGRGQYNLKPILADITRPLPLEDACVDAALLADVLHMPEFRRKQDALSAELRRVLRPGGRLAVLERWRKYGPPDAPAHPFSDPESTEAVFAPHGFRKSGLLRLGGSYLLVLTAE